MAFFYFAALTIETYIILILLLEQSCWKCGFIFGQQSFANSETCYTCVWKCLKFTIHCRFQKQHWSLLFWQVYQPAILLSHVTLTMLVFIAPSKAATKYLFLITAAVLYTGDTATLQQYCMQEIQLPEFLILNNSLAQSTAVCYIATCTDPFKNMMDSTHNFWSHNGKCFAQGSSSHPAKLTSYNRRH